MSRKKILNPKNIIWSIVLMLLVGIAIKEREKYVNNFSSICRQ